MTETTLLQLQDVSCVQGHTAVIEQLSLTLAEQSSLCLLGPSGCGKTTLLRAIAGLHPVTNGQITLNGETLSSPQYVVPAEKRRISLVFQEFALFPHLTVAENISFGIHKLDKPTKDRIVSELLELVKLKSHAQQFPHQLSGGQQQRVALARAMAPKPELILLDEPFCNLDRNLRKSLSIEIRDILRQQKIASILVTHDQSEAFAFGDQIAVMDAGRVQQCDTAFNLYHQPHNKFVAEFVGHGVFIQGIVKSPTTVETEVGIIGGHQPLPFTEGSPVNLLLRPDDVVLNNESTLSATVHSKDFKGANTLYRLALPSGQLIQAMFSSHDDYQMGETIHFVIKAEHLIAFPNHMP